MKTSGVLLLLAALLALGCAVPTITVTPGTCPAPPAKCPDYAQPGKVCAHDGECETGLKCCDFCGKQCKPPVPVPVPVPVTPGTCPIPPAKCPDYAQPGKVCAHDGECEKGLKCCDFCGKQCKPPVPVPVTPGTCPAPPAKCPDYAQPGKVCAHDGECETGLKCCDFCGKQCKPPVPVPVPVPAKPVMVKAGKCPVVMAKCEMPFPPPGCASDSECDDIKKCCDFCGQKCVNPTIVKAGSCPANPDKCKGYEKPTADCTQDGECTGAKKCCDQCGKKCKDPAAVSG